MSRRHDAERWGARAESIAAWWLRLKGWRVLARRFRTPMGEIDLNAARRNVLAIIEVKARDEIDAALDAVHARSRQRIERAAEAFMAGHQHWSKFSPRFDVMIIRPWRPPRHLRDAWRPDWR